MTGQELKQILRDAGVNLAQLAEKLNITPQGLNSRFLVKSVKLEYLEEINHALGRNIITLGHTPNPDGEGIPIYDIRVCAGNGIGLEETEHIIARMNIPSLRGCYGLQVYGDSMRGKYDSGDIIFVQPTDRQNFAWGRPHVIITQDDILLKLIYKSSTNGNVRLVSYNTELLPTGDRAYPDREVFINDIKHTYIVRGSFRQEAN